MTQKNLNYYTVLMRDNEFLFTFSIKVKAESDEAASKMALEEFPLVTIINITKNINNADYYPFF